jgi:hypothetical protein
MMLQLSSCSSSSASSSSSNSLAAVIQALDVMTDNIDESVVQNVLRDLSVQLKWYLTTNDKRIDRLESDNSRLKSDVSRLNTQLEMSELLITAGDIGSLYIHYIFDPAYSKMHRERRTWLNYTNDLAAIEATIEKEQLQCQIEDEPPIDDTVIDDQLAKFSKPIQSQLNVNLEDLRMMKHERACIAHTRLKSAIEQRTFIDHAKLIKTPYQWKYNQLFHTMVNDAVIDQQHATQSMFTRSRRRFSIEGRYL